MTEPPRLPPPPFWRTQYFALTVMAKADRRWIDPLDILHTLRQPVRRERQADGRIRYWLTFPASERIFAWSRSRMAKRFTTCSRIATSSNERRFRLRPHNGQPVYKAASRR